MTTLPPLPPCSILLLAGGRGQRMGGQDKGLLPWRGEPLIAHLHRLTRGLTDDLIVSCNRNLELYAPYADRLVHDDCADFPGPLAGIRAGLAAARHDYLLVLPCDVPQLDAALLHAMRDAARQQPDKPLMLRHGEHWEPLLCVIPVAPGQPQHTAVAGSPWRSVRMTLAMELARDVYVRTSVLKVFTFGETP